LSAEGIRELEDRVIRHLVDAQARTGVELFPDGLLRREDPVRHLALLLSGVAAGKEAERFAGQKRRCTIPVIEAEIAWPGPLLVEDFLFASGGSDRPIKMVAIGPYTLSGLADDRVYGDPNSLAMAFAIAINRELRALQAAGVTFIQIDEPALLDHPDEFPLYSRLWEVLARGVGSTLCLHLEGGSIEPIYPGLMRLKRLGCLSVDGVGAPENIDILRRIPPPAGLRIGIGIIDGTSDSVATAGEIIRQIDGGAGLPPRDRLLLGTASDLGALPTDCAAEKLRELTQAVRALNAA
jgi:5-methyltetrahydropteroyltriglutamate--homocysteine methyltransferase